MWDTASQHHHNSPNNHASLSQHPQTHQHQQQPHTTQPLQRTTTPILSLSPQHLASHTNISATPLGSPRVDPPLSSQPQQSRPLGESNTEVESGEDLGKGGQERRDIGVVKSWEIEDVLCEQTGAVRSQIEELERESPSKAQAIYWSRFAREGPLTAPSPQTAPKLQYTGPRTTPVVHSLPPMIPSGVSSSSYAPPLAHQIPVRGWLQSRDPSSQRPAEPGMRLPVGGGGGQEKSGSCRGTKGEMIFFEGAGSREAQQGQNRKESPRKLTIVSPRQLKSEANKQSAFTQRNKDPYLWTPESQDQPNWAAEMESVTKRVNQSPCRLQHLAYLPAEAKQDFRLNLSRERQQLLSPKDTPIKKGRFREDGDSGSKSSPRARRKIFSLLNPQPRLQSSSNAKPPQHNTTTANRISQALQERRELATEQRKVETQRRDSARQQFAFRDLRAGESSRRVNIFGTKSKEARESSLGKVFPYLKVQGLTGDLGEWFSEHRSEIIFQTEKICSYDLIRRYLSEQEIADRLNLMVEGRVEPRRWCLTLVDEVYSRLKDRYLTA